jgi:L-fuconolactonase
VISFPIIDAHVHLCDPDVMSYGWMADAPDLNRQVLPRDLADAAMPVEVERLVFVEVDVDPPQHLQEAAWVADLARADPVIGGMVASLPLERGAAIESDLDELCEHDILRGVRRLIQSQPDPDFCVQPDFLAGLKLLAARDVPFDICILHHQMPAALEMVRQSPGVRFVLDHIGKPGIRAGLFDPWRQHMREMASMENVFCKISGVVTEADHGTWTPEQVQPYIEHTLDCFGFERCMFGGDWHVLGLAGTYPQWVDIVDDVVANASDEERSSLFRDTATGFYRL